MFYIIIILYHQYINFAKRLIGLNSLWHRVLGLCPNWRVQGESHSLLRVLRGRSH